MIILILPPIFFYSGCVESLSVGIKLYGGVSGGNIVKSRGMF